MSEDPLQLCSVEQWSELEDVFKADIPRSIASFILLQMQRYIKKCGLDHGCKVYCPYGSARYGLVAVNKEKGLYEVIVQCPSYDTSKLKEALKTTKIIDWEREIEIPFAPKYVVNCIEQVIEDKNIGIQFIPATRYFLDKSSSLFDIKLPPEFHFDLLSLEHTDLIASTWPHRFDGCNLYFELIIKAKLGYGLFNQKQLVSWALVRETGSLLHLFTLPNERRKGYGELALKFISNVLLKDGKYVVAYCRKGNVNAAKLYDKLNFQNSVNKCSTTIPTDDVHAGEAAGKD